MADYNSPSDPSDSSDSLPPEVTISPADNGHVVRWYQRSGKKGEPSRKIERVASTKEDALGHADEALGGGGSGKSSKRRSRTIKRDGQTGASLGSGATAVEAGEQSSAPAAHPSHGARRPSRNPARRRRSRNGGRR